MDQALQAADSRLMLFEFAQFGSLGSFLKKVMVPVTDANDPRESQRPPRYVVHDAPVPDWCAATVFQFGLWSTRSGASLVWK